MTELWIRDNQSVKTLDPRSKENSFRCLTSHKTDHWFTPKDFYESLENRFGAFTFDPCPLRADLDGLGPCAWTGKVFVNPPYSNIGAFVSKASREYENRHADLIVMLIPSRTDTRWFHEYIYEKGPRVEFIKGRLKFGGSKNSAPFPSMLVIWGPR